MGRFSIISVVVGVIAWPVAAWAVLQTDSVPTDGQQQFAGRTVKLELDEQKATQVRQSGGTHKPMPRHVKAHTDASGKLVFDSVNSKDQIDPLAPYDVYISNDGGRTYERHGTVAWGDVAGGGLVNIGSVASAPSVPPSAPAIPASSPGLQREMPGFEKTFFAGLNASVGVTVNATNVRTTETNLVGTVTDIFNFDHNGIGANVQVGYDFLFNNMIIGPFGAIMVPGGDATNSFAGGSTYRLRNNVTFVLGGRGGFFIVPSALLFFKGGFVVSDQTYTFDFVGLPKVDVQKTAVGADLGVGLKVLANPHANILGHDTAVFVSAEYNAFLYPNINISPTQVTPGSNLKNDLWVHGISLGLEFRY